MIKEQVEMLNKLEELGMIEAVVMSCKDTDIKPNLHLINTTIDKLGEIDINIQYAVGEAIADLIVQPIVDYVNQKLEAEKNKKAI